VKILIYLADCAIGYPTLLKTKLGLSRPGSDLDIQGSFFNAERSLSIFSRKDS
jgi:hypothetical protein